MAFLFLFVFSTAIRGEAAGALRGSSNNTILAWTEGPTPQLVVGCTPCNENNECTETENCCQNIGDGFCYLPLGCVESTCSVFLDSTFECPEDFRGPGAESPWRGLCVCPAPPNQQWCGDQSASALNMLAPPPSSPLVSPAVEGEAISSVDSSILESTCTPCRADNECTDTENCCQNIDGGLCYTPQGCTAGACPSFLDSTFDCPAVHDDPQDPWEGLCYCPGISLQRWCGDSPSTPSPPPSPLVTLQPTPLAPTPPTPAGPGTQAQAQCHIWLPNEGTCEPLPTPADLARDCLYGGDSPPASACPTTLGDALRATLPPVPEPGSCDSCFKLTLKLWDQGPSGDLGFRSILVQHKGSSFADFEVASHGWTQLCPCLCFAEDNLCVNSASDCPIRPGGPTTPTCQADVGDQPGPCFSSLGLNGITYEEADCP